MFDFVRRRGTSLALVLLVELAIAVAQGAIAYSFTLGGLGQRLGVDVSVLAADGPLTRLGLVALMAALWLLGRKSALFKLVVAANAIATLALLVHTAFLAKVLAGLSFRAVDELLLDVVLISVSNVLTFAVWYWIVDPPGVDERRDEGEPWAFLFPQRASALPGYETWVPGFTDYLYVAFTTSFAFSPTDTLPLTRTAKMLMLLQAAIAVVTLTGIAGSAINILAGGAGG